jgi:2-haloalkanoic acid dehalogenase type II
VSRFYECVTFDCYGTLVDWDRGIGTAIVNAAAAAGVDLGHRRVMAAYHEIEPVVQAEAYRSYREVLEESVRRVAKRFDWELTLEQAAFLPHSIGHWPPFADTHEALGRLVSAGFRLGILSNVDRDLLAQTLAHLEVEFDLIVTAEDVRSYKPAHGHFLAARRRIGEARWLHAAQSYFHDVVPARELDVAVAWINRKHEIPGGSARPDRELSTLAELADWLT